MTSLWSLSSSCVFKPGLISLMYSASSIECNFFVFYFYIVIQLCSSKVVYLYSYYSCNLHSCIVNYTMQLYSYSFIFIQFIVIQFMPLCSLYSYSFKQIMSVERPSIARLSFIIWFMLRSGKRALIWDGHLFERMQFAYYWGWDILSY